MERIFLAKKRQFMKLIHMITISWTFTYCHFLQSGVHDFIIKSVCYFHKLQEIKIGSKVKHVLFCSTIRHTHQIFCIQIWLKESRPHYVTLKKKKKKTFVSRVIYTIRSFMNLKIRRYMVVKNCDNPNAK